MAILPPALLKTNHDPVGKGLQQPGGQPRDHIGLVDGGGDSQLCRRLHHGKTGIAPGADNHLGAKFPQNAPRLPGRPKVISYGD
ncbi:hypothetical protein SDC9_128780 [bioreactor metagenome]|uniref:Uncharacterized protein n=1 Tax=bioreactor metagenome TaxID=1076179 RepID=A0A645CXX8_9ZZZZ